LRLIGVCRCQSAVKWLGFLIHPPGRQMPASTVFMMIVLAAGAMFGPALAILELPFVPNWPYTGLACLVGSAVVGVVYTARVRRHLRRPSPVTPRWLARVFPVWLSVFTLFWSSVRLTIEKDLSLAFSEGVVVEKYRSRNHGYLSVRVEVAGRGILSVEGMSPAAWNVVSAGAKVSKRSGTTDIAVVRP
jgi:hypothetical protein